MIRLVAAGLSALIGLLALILTISALSVVGTNDQAHTQTLKVNEGAYAVVLDEQIVPFADTSVTINASSDAEIFLGTASGVDIRSYLTGVAHQEITGVTFIGDLETRFIDGTAVQADVQSRDWWLEEQTGQNVSYTFDLDAQPQVVVIASAGGIESLAGTTVDMTLDTKGVFALCLLGFALTVLGFAAAVALFLSWRNDEPLVRRPKTASCAIGAAETSAGTRAGTGTGAGFCRAARAGSKKRAGASTTMFTALTEKLRRKDSARASRH